MSDKFYNPTSKRYEGPQLDANGGVASAPSATRAVVLTSIAMGASSAATFASAGDSTVSQYDEAIIAVVTTTASGTSPTLDILYEISPDNGATWIPYVSVATVTAAGTKQTQIPNCIGSMYRILASIGGTTPSFTYAVYLILKRRG